MYSTHLVHGRHQVTVSDSDGEEEEKVMIGGSLSTSSLRLCSLISPFLHLGLYAIIKNNCFSLECELNPLNNFNTTMCRALPNIW